MYLFERRHHHGATRQKERKTSDPRVSGCASRRASPSSNLGERKNGLRAEWEASHGPRKGRSAYLQLEKARALLRASRFPDSPVPRFAHIKHQANRTAGPCLEDTVSTTNVPFSITVGAWKSQVGRDRFIAISFYHLRYEADGLFMKDFAVPSLGCASRGSVERSGDTLLSLMWRRVSAPPIDSRVFTSYVSGLAMIYAGVSGCGVRWQVSSAKWRDDQLVRPVMGIGYGPGTMHESSLFFPFLK